MNNAQSAVVKTAMEIGSLAAQLCPKDQAYVLNTLNTLLFSRQADKAEQQKEERKSTA